jgi:hypothetical protein
LGIQFALAAVDRRMRSLGLSRRIRALLSEVAQRPAIGALRAVTARKARGRPKLFVLTAFEFKTRSVLDSPGPKHVARSAPVF